MQTTVSVISLEDHAWIQEFSSRLNIFLVLTFFTVLQRWSNRLFQEKSINFQGFRGGQIFSSFLGVGGGDPNANFYINPYNL